MKILRHSILCVWAAGSGLAQVGADSGWTFQNQMPTGNALHAVAPVNAENAPGRRERAEGMIAVGDQGAILRTTDAGATWTQVSSGTNAALTGVSFADASTGIAVGSAGAMVRTTDAGATWTQLPSVATAALTGVSLSGDGSGTAVGASGTILRTTDWGSTWTRQTSPTTEHPQRRLFPERQDRNHCRSNRHDYAHSGWRRHLER